MLDLTDWPVTTATEILPRLWMGGIDDDQYLGEPVGEAHYAFDHPFDVVLTLYADAMPAPWGVTEVRYGFPDDDIPDRLITPCLPVAHFGWSAWRAGARVLVRCQQGVNRSGLVTALVLMLDGLAPDEALALLRARRSAAVLNNPTLERWLVNEANHYIPATGQE